MKRTLFLGTAIGCGFMFMVAPAAAQTVAPPSGQTSAPSAQPTTTTVQGASDQSQAAPAIATDADTGLGDIVVTAQRRSENLQRVPIAVAVATAEQLNSSGVDGIANLKIIAPGVEVQQNNGYALPIIRGVGSKASGPGVETPIAIYVDGVYYAAATSSLLEFNNISQVEVLKGPQGTLFGRNATGGLIQITTKDPSRQFGGEVNLTYGNYDTKRGDFYITGPIVGDLRADLAFTGTTMGNGYGTNRFNGRDVGRVFHDVNLRSKWLYEIGGSTEFRAIFDFSDIKHNLSVQRVLPNAIVPPPYGPTYGGRPWDVDLDVQPILTNKTGGASLRVDHDFGGLKLASITAYRETSYFTNYDYDYTRTVGRELLVRQKDHQISQELQLLSPSNQRLTWVVGAFYFDASSRYDPSQIILYGPAQTNSAAGRVAGSQTLSQQETNSISGFGQATLNVVGGLNVTAGLRYTSERRRLVDATQFNVLTSGQTVTTFPLSTRSARFNKLTWRFAVDYRFDNGLLLYLSDNRGFKSGGFNPGTLTIPPFEPEVLDAYEAGFKSSLLDNRIRFNGAGFYYDYKNVQIQIPAITGNGIYNGSAARIYGGEAELIFRATRGLDLKLGYQYTHGRYRDFPLAQIAVPNAAGLLAITRGSASGNVTVLSPASSLSASSTYERAIGPGRLTANVSYYYNSGYFQEPDNLLRQSAYSLVNASLRYRHDSGFSVAAWGQNLTNRAVANLESVQTFGAVGVPRINYAPPRTYGLTIGKEF